MAGRDAIGDVLLIGALGIAGYLIYKAVAAVEQPITTAAGAVASGTDAAAGALATGYVTAFTNPNLVPTGNIVLPNGTIIAVSSLSGGLVMNDSTNQATFSYDGATYEIQGAQSATGAPVTDASGNYIATLVS